jgi:hypothetical protein
MPTFTRRRAGFVACAVVAVAIPAAPMVANVTASAAQASTARASAGPHARHDFGWPAAPVVSVTLNQNDPFVISPNPLSAGPTTISASTTDGNEHQLAALVFNPGVTPAQAVQEIDESYSSDPSVALPALQAVYRDITFSGGLSVAPTGPSWFTENLKPNAYQMADTPEDGAAAQYTTMQVNDPYQPAAWPHFDAVISVRESDGNARFVAPNFLPANLTFLAVNPKGNSQPYEFLLRQLVPGTTKQDLTAYFAAEEAGQTPTSTVFASPYQQGLLPISPGLAAVVHANFTPGLYALMSYVRDPATGIGRVYEGTFKIITLY